MLNLDLVKGLISLLFILSILVLVHEWGHYIVAKLFKMRVEEFSLFFGKVLVRLGTRHGTEYNIRAWPLGGFVKIAGMEPDDISGGRPILEAIRHPQFMEEDAMDKVIRQLDDDTMAGIEASNISPVVRQMIHAAITTDGQLTPSGRQELEIKKTSPNINEDEQKLIEIVLNAGARASDTGLYSQKPIYQRALVIFAGPFMSLFFGYLVFCIMGMTIGMPGDKETNQVQVMPGGAAREAGMMTGDRIVAINGVLTPDGKAMKEIIHHSAKKPLRLTIDRNGSTLYLLVTPRPTEFINEKKVKQTIGLIGVVPNPIFERQGPIKSVREGTLFTRFYITSLVGSLFSKQAREVVGGPIAMVQMGTAVQRLGIAHLCQMAAMFSLGLGIMNLLPIPILDGGHLLLLGIEKVRRRKFSPREVYRAQMIGMCLLALIVGFVMYNDIIRTITGKAFQ